MSDRIGSRIRFDATNLEALRDQLNAAFQLLLSGSLQFNGVRIDKRTSVPTAVPQDQGSPNVVVVTNTGVDTIYFWNGATWVALGSSSGGSILSINFVAPQSGNFNINPVPAALTEWGGANRYRTKADLAGFTEANFYVKVASAGPSNSKVRVQYSTNESAWNYLDSGTGPSVTVDSAGTFESGWVTLVSGAKVDGLYLRPVSIDGDGVAAVNLGLSRIEFR